MFTRRLRSHCLSTQIHHLTSLPSTSFSFSHSSLSEVATENSAKNANLENPVLLTYLVNTLKFPKSKALAVSNRLHRIRTIEKAELIVHFFKSVGFTDPQIQSAVCIAPQILSANVEATLKPKIQLLQDLGITGPDLGKLISANAIVLTRSLEKTLKPCVEVLGEFLINGTVNGDWLRVLSRCPWVIHSSPHLRLIPNISYLKSIGVVGTQLSSLLKRSPYLFVMSESELKRLVSKALDLGFSTNSRMLVYGLHTLGCISHECFLRKLQMIQGFDFSKDECLQMFRRAPGLLRTSEEKLRRGLVFFLEKMKLKKSTLVQKPTLLMLSMEERVIPRYQVLQLIKMKKLLEKEPSLYYAMCLSEGAFVDRFISRFTENADELSMAYKGNLLNVEKSKNVYKKIFPAMSFCVDL